MASKLYINANRDGYAPEQVRHTMTIRELVEALEEQAEELGEDALVYLSHDRGYTFGGVTDLDLHPQVEVWWVSVQNANPWCMDEWVHEEFETREEAEARYAEELERFDADHWVVDSNGLVLTLNCDVDGDTRTVERVELEEVTV